MRTALTRADAGATVILDADHRPVGAGDQVLAVVKRAGVTRLGFEGLAGMGE